MVFFLYDVVVCLFISLISSFLYHYFHSSPIITHHHHTAQMPKDPIDNGFDKPYYHYKTITFCSFLIVMRLRRQQQQQQQQRFFVACIFIHYFSGVFLVSSFFFFFFFFLYHKFFISITHHHHTAKCPSPIDKGFYEQYYHYKTTLVHIFPILWVSKYLSVSTTPTNKSIHQLSFHPFPLNTTIVLQQLAVGIVIVSGRFDSVYHLCEVDFFKPFFIFHFSFFIFHFALLSCVFIFFGLQNVSLYTSCLLHASFFKWCCDIITIGWKTI